MQFYLSSCYFNPEPQFIYKLYHLFVPILTYTYTFYYCNHAKDEVLQDCIIIVYSAKEVEQGLNT